MQKLRNSMKSGFHYRSNASTRTNTYPGPRGFLWFFSSLDFFFREVASYSRLEFPSSRKEEKSRKISGTRVTNTLIVISPRASTEDPNFPFFLCFRFCLRLRCNKWKRNTAQANENMDPDYLAPNSLKSSDDFACAFVSVEFHFHLGHPYWLRLRR